MAKALILAIYLMLALGVPQDRTESWYVLEVLPNQGCTPVPGKQDWDQVRELQKFSLETHLPLFIIYRSDVYPAHTIDGCFKDYPQGLVGPNRL